MNIAYNMDCLEAMRAMKDNEFDLAVVDPPYGDALHDERGCGGGWFQKFKPTDSSQVVQVERERERDGTDLADDLTNTSRKSKTHYTFGIRKSSPNYEAKLLEAQERRKKS